MARLTQDEAFRLVDRFSDFIYELVGEDVAVHQQPGRFTVEVLRQKARALPQRRLPGVLSQPSMEGWKA